MFGERSFIMLHKLLSKIFPQIMYGNIWDYMQMNHLSKSMLFKMLVYKCNFLLEFLLKINANFSQFYCNKNLHYLYIVKTYYVLEIQRTINKSTTAVKLNLYFFKSFFTLITPKILFYCANYLCAICIYALFF